MKGISLRSLLHKSSSFSTSSSSSSSSNGSPLTREYLFESTPKSVSFNNYFDESNTHYYYDKYDSN